MEYVRRKAFGFKDDFNSIEEANEYLEKICLELNQKPQKEHHNQSALDMLHMEQEYLLPKVPMYDAAKTVEPRVDKYSTIVIDQNHYSVPEQHVGKIIFVKVYTHQIICYHEGEKIAIHQRKYGLHEWSIQLDHYLKTLKKKPGALSTSVALQQADPRLQKIYQQHYTKKEKDFIELLHFVRETSIEQVEKAIKDLNKLCPLDISTEKIKTLCQRQASLPISQGANAKESETTKMAEEMLQAFGALIPSSGQKFKKEVPVL